MMATVLKRELTAEEQADTRRLAAAWKNYQATHPSATQSWLGKETGLGGQGLIGQYLRGIIPLNHKALLAICKVIAVAPQEISSTLSATIPATALEQARQQCSALAWSVATAFDQLTPRQQQAVMGMIASYGNTDLGAVKTSEAALDMQGIKKFEIPGKSAASQKKTG